MPVVPADKLLAVVALTLDTRMCLAKARPVSNIVICVLSWNRGRRIPELCIV